MKKTKNCPPSADSLVGGKNQSHHFELCYFYACFLDVLFFFLIINGY